MQIPAEFVDRPIVALCGGIGGSKLALGLQRIAARQLTVIVNTGDDFEHLDLSVSPDVDTVLYTLAGLADPVRGWGRRDETWTFMAALAALGGETWFQFGDQDLATHIERTRRLRDGEPLSAIIADFACAWGIAARVLPMSDDKVRTMVETDVGVLPFQDFFVRRQCAPRVKAVRYDGAQAAVALPSALEAIGNPDLAAVIVCPSNPWLSIDPLLALPALRSATMASPAPVIAVSPIVAGRAIKGPTAKIMAELGLEISAAQIARHYGRLIDGFIVDDADAGIASEIDCPIHVTNTVMESLADREQLAFSCLEFAAQLRIEQAHSQQPVKEATRDR